MTEINQSAGAAGTFRKGGFQKRLMSAIKPKTAMTTPENLLTHRNEGVENLERKKPIPPLNRNHHKIDPQKTPETRNTETR